MFQNNSLTTRIAIGKLTGFFVAFVGVILFNWLTYYELPTKFAFGIILWYTTIGTIIGIFGVYDYHPVLKFPMKWWFRSSIIGAWMNFVLALLTYNELEEIIFIALGADTMFQSPFWFVIEGAVVGLLIGYLATKLGGEGKDIAGK